MKPIEGTVLTAARSLAGFARSNSGASAIEYSLLAALIAVAMIAAAATAGVSLHDLYVMFGNLDAWGAQP